MAAENDGLDASGQVEASDSAHNEVLMAENESGDESDDSSATVLVNFLMCMCPSLDVTNYPRFRTLLEGVVRDGERCCALLENPRVIQKSLWKFEHAMKQHMQMVMQSWKTTGFSVMFYNLKQDSAPHNPQKLVLGLYCPMGFFFVEVPPSKQVNRFFNYYDIWNALQDFVPDLSFCKDVIQFIDHDPSYKGECQYQASDLSDTTESSVAFCRERHGAEIKCFRQQVEVFWRNICQKSKWVKGLIMKSNKVYKYIVSSDLYGKFYKTLKKKKLTWRLTRLAIIVDLEGELKAWLSQLSEGQRSYLESNTGVPAVIENNEFWNDGKELLQALAPLFEIPHLMNTLVPSAGYLGVAMARAEAVLKTHCEHHPLKYELIWNYFDDWPLAQAQVATDYLSPAYILYQMREQEIPNLYDVCVWNVMYDVVQAYKDDEREVLGAEIEAYSTISTNPFANISISEVDANHPTMLWSKYGAQFPLLQKCAYKLLSQPSCCLCKQVEKHVSKIGQADNYILKLNALMMEEFRTMGNQVYPPSMYSSAVPDMGFL